MMMSIEEHREAALRILTALIAASPPKTYGELETMTIHASVAARNLDHSVRRHATEEPKKPDPYPGEGRPGEPLKYWQTRG